MLEVAPWHTLTVEAVAARLSSDLNQGFTGAEVAKRRARVGLNRIQEQRAKSAWAILLGQLQDFMVLVLLGAAAVSFLFREPADGSAILAIVAVNAVLGYLQEARAERSLEALRRLAAPTARLLRDGVEVEVPAEEVVPGDVLILTAGDRVPADGRLTIANLLETEESALSGESLPVEKTVAPLPDEHLQPGDRSNMVFQGSHVTRGRGRALVVATGMQTEVGRIAGLIRSAGEAATPLQRRLDQLGHVLVLACLAISAAVVAGGVLRGENPYRMFLAGVSLAVAAIPEGLPAIVTIALALGVQRMIRKNAIVRRLPAVETLGCATVICSDKTGTLTQNRMAVRVAWAAGRSYGPEDEPDEALRRALQAAARCSNATETDGDPTEVALVQAARAAGVNGAVSRRAELPFEPERRRMSVVCGDSLYLKGAIDEVLARSRWWWTPQGRLPLDSAAVAKIRAAGDGMAAQALRVLAVAERGCPAGAMGPQSLERLETDLVFLGLFGLMDPPRPEARDAVRRCREAGVRVVMITGDHALTARAVAEDLSLLPAGGAVVTGEEMSGWSERELVRRVDHINAFARISPAGKLRIVRALKARGHVVAMTGDGVNDAPAVREADIGVAMGRSGTDVTKEAAAMILTDDNFATIVAAVEEGRAIYDNVRKFIRYLLACNTGEILVMLLATLVGLPLPLLPLQMLLVNLVTDGLPALALGVDPPSPGVMRRPPRAPEESVFARGLGRLIVFRGCLIGICTLAVFWAVLSEGGDLMLARTVSMCTLVLSQLLHAFDARSETRSIWQLGFFSNPILVAATCSSLAVLLVVLYVAPLAGLFRVVPLSLLVWLPILAVSGAGAGLAGLGDLARLWLRRYRYRQRVAA